MPNSASTGTKLAYLLAVLNAVVIGISFTFVKMTLDYTSPIDSLTFRFAAAFVILSILATCGSFKLNYRGKPLRQLLLLASMYPIGFFMLQAFGLQYATSAEGGIINAFTPVATMVLAAAFLKEATSYLQKLSTLLSVFGVLFIFIMKGSSIDLSNMKGIALLLMACVVFAGYSVLSRSISTFFSPAEISFFMVGVGFAVSLVLSLAIHSSGGTLSNLVKPLVDVTFIMLIVYLGIVQIVTALMGSYILSRIEASKMGVFIHLSTVVSLAAGAWVLKESIAWYHLLGSAFIIAGVIGTNFLGRKKAGQLAAPAKLH
ncbi:DMT family transporter [Paenibacillus harenae]|uniref:DMT family transporter n=1 Tax=Paenibacillus harenae TaxID=306543 RepID=UPI0003FAAA6D|nr:DMT family transporter [Paenibacillus harenae]